MNFRHLVFFLIAVLLFVPKIDLFTPPGISTAIKPEDFVWGIMFLCLFFTRNRLKNPVVISFCVLLIYLAITMIIFPENVLLVARLVFYSMPILVYVNFEHIEKRNLARMLKIFSIIFALIAILQISIPMPYVHSGQIFIGQTDRASGIFGNGVEFALVAFFIFWILKMLNMITIFNWICLLLIGFASGSRVVTLALLLSGLIFLNKPKKVIILTLSSIPLIALIFLVQFSTNEIEEESRFNDIDVRELYTAASYVIDLIEPKTLPQDQIGNYCFVFDDNLSEDQSFAMRLSKLKFVMEYVVLGSHKFGFGLSKCIGDAGDNLFVRVLSDGGIIYLFLLIIFIYFVSKIRSKSINRQEWLLFIGLFIIVSFFYDTLYFSRVAPLFFIIVSLALSNKTNALVKN